MFEYPTILIIPLQDDDKEHAAESNGEEDWERKGGECITTL